MAAVNPVECYVARGGVSVTFAFRDAIRRAEGRRAFVIYGGEAYEILHGVDKAEMEQELMRQWAERTGGG